MGRPPHSSASWTGYYDHTTITQPRILMTLSSTAATGNPTWATCLLSKPGYLGLEEADYLGPHRGTRLLSPGQTVGRGAEHQDLASALKQVRTFLILVGYYCQFVPAFATTAAPSMSSQGRISPTRFAGSRRQWTPYRPCGAASVTTQYSPRTTPNPSCYKQTSSPKSRTKRNTPSYTWVENYSNTSITTPP